MITYTACPISLVLPVNPIVFGHWHPGRTITVLSVALVLRLSSDRACL